MAKRKSSSDLVLILRKPVFPEDEGRYFPIKRCSRKEAKEWIAAQKDEYFRPSDYQIAELIWEDTNNAKAR